MTNLKLVRTNGRRKKGKKVFSALFQKKQHQPFFKGVCVKVYTITPKKPNSAIRKVAKIKASNERIYIAYIPGIKHNLQEHSKVLVKAHRRKDLIGVRYMIIRGKYDCGSVENRKTSPSSYGVKMSQRKKA